MVYKTSLVLLLREIILMSDAISYQADDVDRKTYKYNENLYFFN